MTAGVAHAAPVPLTPGAGDLPRPAVILFWASWCGSCRAEMRRLPEIAAAARPLAVATIALDPPATARAALGSFAIPSAAAYADGRPPADVLAEWAGAGAMLPLAAAIDRAGRVCGLKSGLLGTGEVKAWAARCSK